MINFKDTPSHISINFLELYFSLVYLLIFLSKLYHGDHTYFKFKFRTFQDNFVIFLGQNKNEFEDICTTNNLDFSGLSF